jgi:hypothetical protein
MIYVSSGAYSIFFIICFTILAILSSVGAVMYFKKDLRKKVDLKEVWRFFWVMVVLKTCDVLSTIYFTNKIGIEYEGNLLAKSFMLKFGILWGLFLITIIMLVFVFFWTVFMNYVFKKTKKWKIFKATLIVSNIIVVIINMTA